ncbi:MAG TPA: hypothetical protein VK937_14625 [Candidatus Limnocylindria bacterium]|nr:hypothetical protein [Candidatus Limnocylindria bacterium]
MRRVMYLFLAGLLIAAGFSGCDSEKVHTKLVYFGFDDSSEKTEDAIQLAKTWGSSPHCPHWRSTINKKDADYQVLFGGRVEIEKVTVIDRRGELLYSGGVGVIYAPHGNPDGSGVNICKLTGE